MSKIELSLSRLSMKYSYVSNCTEVLMRIFLITFIFYTTLMAKTAIVLPGLFAQGDNENNSEIAAHLKQLNYQVIQVNITWKDFDLDKYTHEMMEQVLDNYVPDDKLLIIGSSYGTVLATRLAKHNIIGDHYIFVSPPPLYFEYTDKRKKLAWPNLAEILFKNSKEDSIDEFAQVINSNAATMNIIYGSKELRHFKKFPRFLKSRVFWSRIHKVKRAGHGVKQTKNRNKTISVLRSLEVSWPEREDRIRIMSSI